MIYYSLRKAGEILRNSGKAYSAKYLVLLAKKGKLKAFKQGNLWVTTDKWISGFLETNGSRLSVNYKKGEWKKKIEFPVFFSILGWRPYITITIALRKISSRIFWPFKKYWQARTAALSLGFASIFIFLSMYQLGLASISNSLDGVLNPDIPSITVNIENSDGDVKQVRGKIKGEDLNIIDSSFRLEITDTDNIPDTLSVFIDSANSEDKNIKTKVLYLGDNAGLEFETARVTLNKSVFTKINAVLSCPDWAFNKEDATCQEWEVTPINPDSNLTNVTFETNHFSAVAGAYLEIINAQTNLTQGQTWTARFRAFGQSDLIIEPIDGTEYPRDLEFLGFYCGDERIDNDPNNNDQPVYDGTRVYLKDYSCEGKISRIENRAVTPGVHRLRFIFNDNTYYAKNFACTMGTLDTTCYVTTTVAFAAGETIGGAGNLWVIPATTTADIGKLTTTATNFGYIEMAGDIIVSSTDGLNGNFHVTSTNFEIKPTGSINANGKGYAGGTGNNNGSGSGGGSGAYRSVSCSSCYTYGSGSSGGGYGGTGGAGSAYSGGSVYDYTNIFLTKPTSLGSGGGGSYVGNPWNSLSCNATGGSGGGAIRLNVSGTLTVSGSITANGAVGGGCTQAGAYGSGVTGYAAGGSGGSIWIKAGIITGNGTTTANGGNGLSTSWNGGGGGGRLAINYTTDTYTGLFAAYGALGYGSLYAGAGTVYKRDTAGQVYGDLIIGNNNNNASTTPLIGDLYDFDNTIFKNGAKIVFGGLTFFSGGDFQVASGTVYFNIPTTTNATFTSITIPEETTLTYDSGITLNKYSLNFNCTGDASIGGVISLNGKGYAGGYGNHVGYGPGGGSGAYRSVSCGSCYTYGSGSSGGGYGGVGGAGSAYAGGPACTANSREGSISQPLIPGSGGGGSYVGNPWNSLSCNATGGSGGGAIRLNVSGTLTVSGSITANGAVGGGCTQAGAYGSGVTGYAAGGSGGSIYIITNVLDGIGAITANGGNGASASWNGGGAGGRIAIYTNSDTSSINPTRTGGTGYGSGKAGSAFIDITAPDDSTTTPVCDTSGNGCSEIGRVADPPQPYRVDYISGYATDTASGIYKVEISIEDTTASLWYSSTSSDFTAADEYWIIAGDYGSFITTSTSWTYDSTLIPWEANHQYQVRSRAYNGNFMETAKNEYQTFIMTNSPPVISNVTSIQRDADDVLGGDGRVIIGYDSTDAESATLATYLLYTTRAVLASDIDNSVATITVTDGTNFPSGSATILIDEEMMACTGRSGNNLTGCTRGVLNTNANSHTAGAARLVWIKVGDGEAIGDIGAAVAKGTDKSIIWFATSTISGYYLANAQIIVSANDGAASNQIVSASSSSYVLDTKSPSPGTVPLSVSATTTPATMTFDCTDDTYLEVITSTDPLFAGASWRQYTASSQVPLATDPDSVYAQFRDLKNNKTVVYSATTTETPTYLILQDTSNMTMTPAGYALFVSWKEMADTPQPGFKRYHVSRATDSSGPYETIGVTPTGYKSVNYYQDNTTAAETFYYYKVSSEDLDGNISYYSSSVGPGKANGIADYGEGGGGSGDAPTVSNLATSSDAIDTSWATITWETNQLATSSVSYSTSEYGPFDTTTTVNSLRDTVAAYGRHSVTISDLLADTTYFFRVHSTNAYGLTTTSDNQGAGFRVTTKPGPVLSNVTAQNVTNNSATIAWNTDTNANSAVIYDTNTLFTNGATITDATLGLSHSIPLSGLTTGARYYYYVSSTDALGQTGTNKNVVSGQIQYFTFDTTQDTTPPSIFSITATSTEYSSIINWQTNEESTSRVAYATTTGQYYESGFTAENTTTTRIHSVQITGLTGASTYYFKVYSKDASGNGATSTEYNLTTADTVAPVITFTGTTTDLVSATTTWTTNETADGWIDYGTTLAYGYTVGSLSFDTNHEVGLIDLTPNTTYKFRIRSYDIYGNMATDDNGGLGYQFTTIQDTTAPVVATTSVAVASYSDTQATIIWTTNELSTSLVGYGETTDYGSTSTEDVTLTYLHAVTITGLSRETTYYYKVFSSDSAGNRGELASTTAFTFTTTEEPGVIVVNIIQQVAGGSSSQPPPDTIPPNIMSLKVEDITNTTAKVVFQTDDGAASYVRYGTSMSYSNETSRSQGYLYSHEHRLSSLIPGTIYHVQASALDMAGNKSESSDVTFKTTGTAPEGETEPVPPTATTTAPGGEEEPPAELTEEEVRLRQQVLELFKDYPAFSIEKVFSDVAKKVISSPVLVGDYPKVDVGPTFAKVSWITDRQANSLVAYVIENKYVPISESPYTQEVGNSQEMVFSHEVEITGLEPSTVYHYQARSKSEIGPILMSSDKTFKTTSLLPEISDINFTDVSEYRAMLGWKTNIPCQSTITYTNLKTGDKKTTEDRQYVRDHSMELKNLEPSISYSLSIVAQDEKKNSVTSPIITFQTGKDSSAPSITTVITDTAISPRGDRVQAIISWATDEPSTSQVFYQEGVVYDATLIKSTAKDKTLTRKHVVVVSDFRPATVYLFRIQSEDSSSNIALSQDFTLLTPQQRKSILQIMIANFEQTFGWVRKIGF